MRTNFLANPKLGVTAEQFILNLSQQDYELEKPSKNKVLFNPKTMLFENPCQGNQADLSNQSMPVQIDNKNTQCH